MKTIISFEWWDENNQDPPENRKEELIENAIERVNEMTRQGYISGDLNYEWTDSETEEVETYSGWWEFSAPQ